MSRITFWGDFKADFVNHLNLSGELMLLLNNSELNVANFEAPVYTPSSVHIKKSGPNISQNVDAPEWLELRGFNAISLANNHTMDYGDDGLEATRTCFKTASTMGAGLWKEAYKPHIFNLKNGVKVGIICCSHREFGTLSDEWTERDKKGCAWTLNPNIERECKDLLMGGVNLSYIHMGELNLWMYHYLNGEISIEDLLIGVQMP